MASELEVGKVGIGTAPIADSKLDIAGAGTQRLYVRETGSTVKTKLLTTTSKGAVGTETNHPLELQTNDQTRVTIASTGEVTVNESVAIGTSPTSGISLNVRENSTTTAADIRNANASGFGLYVAGGSSSSEYAFRAANKDNTALFTVRGDGLAEFSNGIAFQSATTGSGTGVGYTLDSYEEGLWTPVIADASSGGNTGSGTTVQGYYTRIGNKVTVSGICTNIDTSGMTASNDLFIRGLPFQSGYASGTNANLGRASGSCVLDQFNIDASCYGVVPMVFAGETYFNLMEMQDANNDDVVLVSEVTSGSADLFFTITYFV